LLLNFSFSSGNFPLFTSNISTESSNFLILECILQLIVIFNTIFLVISPTFLTSSNWYIIIIQLIKSRRFILSIRHLNRRSINFIQRNGFNWTSHIRNFYWSRPLHFIQHTRPFFILHTSSVILIEIRLEILKLRMLLVCIQLLRCWWNLTVNINTHSDHLLLLLN